MTACDVFDSDLWEAGVAYVLICMMSWEAKAKCSPETHLRGAPAPGVNLEVHAEWISAEHGYIWVEDLNKDLI